MRLPYFPLTLGSICRVAYYGSMGHTCYWRWPCSIALCCCFSKERAKTLLISSSALGNGGSIALDGLATSIQEMNNRGHREDTIKSGYFLCDQDIVTAKTNMAIDEMNHLEKAGVVFSRDAKELPLTKKGIGHSSPRVVDAGDASVRDVQQVLEEQCMKHGVVKRRSTTNTISLHKTESRRGNYIRYG